MEDLPEDVVRYCVNTRTGIQQEYPRFPPNVGEIGEFIGKAKLRVEGLRIIEERERLGFKWTDNPADNMVGFYNAQGIEWRRRDVPRLAAPKRLTPEEQAQRERAITTALRRVDGPQFKVPLTPDDGRHAERIAADLAARKARNEAREAEPKQEEGQC